MSVGIIIGDPRIDVSVTAPVASVLPGTPVAREYLNADPYYGEYEVTPGDEAQTLSTQGKRMAYDITINPIPSNYGKITWNGSVLTVS